MTRSELENKMNNKCLAFSVLQIEEKKQSLDILDRYFLIFLNLYLLLSSGKKKCRKFCKEDYGNPEFSQHHLAHVGLGRVYMPIYRSFELVCFLNMEKG